MPIRRPQFPLVSRLVLAAVLLFLLVPWIVAFYADWLWLGETGYQQVVLTEVTTRSWLGLAAFAVVFGLLFGNLRLAVRWLLRPYMVLAIGFGPAKVTIGRRGLQTGAAVVAGGLALLVSLYVSNQWLTWQLFRHRMPFGQADPLLGLDASFYVFVLPMLELARDLCLLVPGLALAGAIAIYVGGGALRFLPGVGLSFDSRPLMHVSALLAAIFLALAFGTYLSVPQLLLTPSGIIQGASYTDVHAKWPALRVLLGTAAVGAALSVANLWIRKLWPILAAAAIALLVWMGGNVYATIVQRFIVAPNEQAREAPYIAHNVRATREAFGLGAIEERQVSGDAVLSRADIDRNADTLTNVRLWDHQPLLDTFGQIQEIRTYYDFVSVDNDRYRINGQYRQIMLSARELNSASLPNRTWPNERLTFTHGYGVALGPVNQVTREGLPVLFIKNLPPESSVDLTLTQPSLYFGELASDYVFVKTRAREFHYPRGDNNEYSIYDGRGGVAIGTFLRKVLFSVRFESLKILLSEDLTAESRILFHRNIRERVDAIASFLRYDPDPYLVIADGRLVWILDAYTWTDRYPYATEAMNGINYIRNSIKVTIDAYDGTTMFYLADPRDPLAASLGRVFPGFVKPLSDMPAALRAHVRYPEALFGIQAAMFATYHMTNPAVFYNKEDQWEVPALESGQNAAPMEPYYTMMRLPGERAAEFIQMLPFTPRRKDNLAAWMVARSDGDHYGKLLVFQFPKQKVVFGPRQLVARINQDQVISPLITLWNQQGSEVIWGTLLVIPVEESLIYVRPLYLRSAGGRIPELKRVIVAHQNQIVMDETLEAALDRIFGGGAAAPAGGQPPRATADQAVEPSAPAGAGDRELERLASEARTHYERALQAQREGNWTAYGEEIKLLGAILQKMKRQ
ncbi:MAG: UPF0182 family protein [Acidobacteria bacterium]|nr:UPF0182 family protein [Acidobacteriota bacterium]